MPEPKKANDTSKREEEDFEPDFDFFDEEEITKEKISALHPDTKRKIKDYIDSQKRYISWDKKELDSRWKKNIDLNIDIDELKKQACMKILLDDCFSSKSLRQLSDLLNSEKVTVLMTIGLSLFTILNCFASIKTILKK